MKAYQLGFKKMQKPDLVHGNVLHNNMLFAVSLKRKYGIPFVIRNWRIVKVATTKAHRKLFFNLRSLKKTNNQLTLEEAEAIAKDYSRVRFEC
jgi:hypothetical protein